MSTADISRPRRSLDPVRVVLDVVSWGALTAFVVITVVVTMVERQVFLATDLLSLVAPWASDGVVPLGADSYHVADTIDTIAPQTMAIADSVRAGGLQQWDPYSAGGVELGGLPNSGAWSPLSLPWFVLPATVAPAVVKILEIVTITIGMSLFLRRLRLPSFSRALASLVFASSGFMLAWTNWPQTRVAALIPLLFWAIDRASTSARVRDAVPVALVLSAMLLGGFPAVVAYALYAGGLYAILRAALHHRSVVGVLRALAVNAGGLVISVALSAVLLVPFVVNASSVLDFSVRDQSTRAKLGWDDVASMVVPSLTGTADGRIVVDGSPVEGLSYVGVAALALVALALILRRTRREVGMPLIFAMCAVVVCIVLVYLGGPALALAQELPVLGDNYIGRLRVVLGFFLAVAAAFGITRLAGLEETDGRGISSLLRRPSVWQLAGVVVAGALVALVAFAVRRTLFVVPASFVPETRQDVVDALVLGAITAAVLLTALLLGRYRPVRALAAAAAVVLVAGPATATATSWWPRADASTFYPQTETHEFLEANVGEDRIATVGDAMKPGTSSVYDLRTLGGHAFQTTEWKDLLARADPDSFLSPTYSTQNPSTIARTIGSPVLDRLAVRYVVAAPDAMPIGQPTGLSGQTGDAPFEGTMSSPTGTGPVRGVLLLLDDELMDPDGFTVSATLTDPTDGDEIATSSYRTSYTNGELWISLAGDDVPVDGSWVLDITVDDLDEDTTVAVDANGLLALTYVAPVEGDGVRIVHAGDATVYERENAADRVRWAAEAVVVEDDDDRLAMMDDASTPASTVVLEQSDDERPVDAGSTARIDDTSTGTDVQSYDVSAAGAGWLVVADSFRRPGWSATVDGRPADLVPAEHAAAAVHLEAGEHRVVLTYETPGRGLGITISLVSVAVVVVVSAASWIILRRRRTSMIAGEEVVSGPDAR